MHGLVIYIVLAITSCTSRIASGMVIPVTFFNKKLLLSNCKLSKVKRGNVVHVKIILVLYRGNPQKGVPKVQ
ncbi:hypothetical protein AAZX31_18G123200 [Glycine max]